MLVATYVLFGFGFALGLDTEGKAGFWSLLLTVVAWPMLLGFDVGRKMASGLIYRKHIL